MNKFLALSDTQRKSIFESIEHKVGLPAQVIEKDFWVTTSLQLIFSLPIAEHLVFKGGTSLSKGWHLIDRFSEDIDIVVNPIVFGMPQGDLTKRQIKQLRKRSSLFVLEELSCIIEEYIRKQGLDHFITITPQPNGKGDKTYPEPRQIYLKYKSVFQDKLNYLRPDIVLEVSARSLLEPSEAIQIKSILAENIPIQPLMNSYIYTAVPAKTFLEKVFLLHELFSVPEYGMRAERKSRHIYDVFMMMKKDFAKQAIIDDELWETIRHHREVFTSVKDVDYTPDVRKRIQLIPPSDMLNIWKADYRAMMDSMIYGEKPSFEELIVAMEQLQNRFRNNGLK